MKKKILLIFGTRPEAIKMAPVYWEFKNHSDIFNTRVCVTGQHRQMLDQVLDFFKIQPDYDLNLMKNNQSLFEITANSIKALEKVLEDFKPDVVFVQGDTTTAFAGALAAYYKKIKVGHIEAGLRSYDKYSPYPEEINRVLIGHITDYHFAPTLQAKKNLIAENIKKNVWVVGNTVIDALFLGLGKISEDVSLKKKIESYFESLFKQEINSINMILVTGHRRESFGEGFENICMAIKEIAIKHQDYHIVYPVHLNPNVREPVNKILKGINNVHLIEPLDYPCLIWLMSKSYLVLTDSGGIQEEAPSLGKPVIVMRNVTERIEGIKAGTAILAGTNKERIFYFTNKLIKNKNYYNKMSKAVNPYGAGKSSKKIVQRLIKVL